MSLIPVDRYNKELSPEARRLLDMIRNRPINEEDKEWIIEELKGMNQTTAGKYIMCVLFPELSDQCRFPMTFPSHTAVFRVTETYEFYPGSDNSFFIEYFTQNVSFKEDDDIASNAEVHNVAPGLLTLRPQDVTEVARKIKRKIWNFDGFLKNISNYADKAINLLAKGSSIAS